MWTAGRRQSTPRRSNDLYARSLDANDRAIQSVSTKRSSPADGGPSQAFRRALRLLCDIYPDATSLSASALRQGRRWMSAADNPHADHWANIRSAPPAPLRSTCRSFIANRRRSIHDPYDFITTNDIMAAFGIAGDRSPGSRHRRRVSTATSTRWAAITATMERSTAPSLSRRLRSRKRWRKSIPRLLVAG